MGVYSINGGSRITVSTDNIIATSEISTMEHFDNLLNQARESFGNLIGSVGGDISDELIREMRQASSSYRQILNTIDQFTGDGWLRYYYKDIQEAARYELQQTHDVIVSTLIYGRYDDDGLQLH